MLNKSNLYYRSHHSYDSLLTSECESFTDNPFRRFALERPEISDRATFEYTIHLQHLFQHWLKFFFFFFIFKFSFVVAGLQEFWRDFLGWVGQFRNFRNSKFNLKKLRSFDLLQNGPTPRKKFKLQIFK